MHYGVKGMKWGVRRFQNYDGTPILKKGTIVKRVSTSYSDPTYDNKKYVSINQKDHDKWQTYIGEAYLKRNLATYSQTYVTTKDLRIASSAEQGRIFSEMLLENDFKNKAIRDIEFSDRSLRQSPTENNAENISRNIAMQTETGKAFVKKLQSMNYDAIFDTHGTNVSENPLIVLSPDENLKKLNTEYTDPVKDFLKKYNEERVA